MYIHRASELANFVKHISTKAFEFLVVEKTTKKPVQNALFTFIIG